VFAAFLVHRPDVPDGMRAGHLRCELREQTHLGLCPLGHRIGGKYELLKHQFLRAEHETGGTLVGLETTVVACPGAAATASESSGMDMMTSGPGFI
jgi:hypothetical protein